ncbi:MAG TPA: EAL domain-containing protein [Steroidobacteraceae bacterium]|nr:EAL domain-containing protein [Steroidobacteraceae bacterium]
MRAADEGFASCGKEAQADSGPAFPRALLPDTTCPEAALAKSNRELRMLIDCKRSLARAQDEQQLLTEICRILVGPGGYRLAWIGYADAEPDCNVRVVAQAGHDSGYLERSRVSWSDDERGRGPTGRAIRERSVQMCRHIDTDPHFSPWREQAHREGYRSSVALPLLLESQCIGALCIYSGHPDAFDPPELALLTELAADLAFGLNALHVRAQMRRQQQQLDRQAQIVRVHSAINSAVIRIRNRDELLQEACRLAVELGGFFGAVVWVVDGSGRWAWMKYRAGPEVRDYETLQRIEIGDGTGPDPSLSGRALRTGKVTVCTDIARGDAPVAARERLLARGIRSLIALPLIVEDKRVAVLTLSACDPAPADDGELLRLLENVAASLAFALHSLESADAAQYLASFDPLTGLAKRALFCERLDKEWQSRSTAAAHAPAPAGTSGPAEAARAVVIAFDVRELGSINTLYGQRFGDLLLQTLAKRLYRHAGDYEHIAYLGAGTFALLERVPPAVTESPCLALDAALLHEPFEIEGRGIRLAVTCGAAEHSQEVASGAILVQRAEAALKRAKESGERYLNYRPEMSRETVQRVVLEHRLRTALAEQQFVLHYQPQIDLASGQIDSAEALLRWRDPGGGLVLPGRFLPVLESSGMIVPLGNWTLLKAVEDLEGWCRAGCGPMRLAVNVSAQQLKQREFLHGLLGLADRLAPLVGFGLDIEITETTLLQDLEGTSEKLRELRKAGIRVALDDFGTGYSSLGLLSKLPVDVLKIDRSFVSGLPEDAASVTLVVSIVELASAFDLITVAEGVETAEQLAALRALRCSHAQGFLHSPAVPARELEQMLARRNALRAQGSCKTNPPNGRRPAWPN